MSLGDFKFPETKIEGPIPPPEKILDGPNVIWWGDFRQWKGSCMCRGCRPNKRRALRWACNKARRWARRKRKQSDLRENYDS